MAIFQKYHGESHLTTAIAIHKIAIYCASIGDIKKAEEYLKKSLKIFKQLYYPEAHVAFEDLAELCLKKYNASKTRLEKESLKNEAIDYLKKALRITETHFPKDSLHNIKIINKINTIKFQ